MANFAERFAQKCVFQHSKSYERKIAAGAYGAVGENVHFSMGTSNDFEDFVLSDWGLREKMNYDFDSNSCESGKSCLDYTQVGRLDIKLTSYM